MTDTVNGGHVSGDRLNALLQVLWEKNRSVVLARIATIERAVSELAGGPGNSSSPSNARRSAEWEAHKLAGSLGTFGFHRGTEIAREIELTLAVARDLDSSEVLHMSDLTLQLRGEVEKERSGPVPSSPPPAPTVPWPESAPSQPGSESPGNGSIEMIQGADDNNDDEPLTETNLMNSSPGKETTFTAALPVDVDPRGGEGS